MAKLLALFAIAASFLLIFSNNMRVAGDCIDDWNVLKDKCTDFVKLGQPPALPSTDCCQAIAKADLPCACSKITSDIEKIIIVPLAVLIARLCGSPIPHGTKCGDTPIP